MVNNKRCCVILGLTQISLYVAISMIYGLVAVKSPARLGKLCRVVRHSPQEGPLLLNNAGTVTLDRERGRPVLETRGR